MKQEGLRAIDFHVHPPTVEWVDGSMKDYIEPAERYFRSPVVRRTMEGVASEYREMNVAAVLLAWDAEMATGRPRLSNESVAEAVRQFPDVFVGFASVDPRRGPAAIDQLSQAADLGLSGAKFHPSMQGFDPSDEQYWPVFAKCQDLGFPCVFHSGTSGIGARTKGGQGIRIDLSHPLRLDSVAAAFPDLVLIAAHMGYPWHADLLAMAVHKTNVYIDTSGFAPKYIPTEVLREMRGTLQDQIVFGSDYPFIGLERCLTEFASLDLSESVMSKVLVGNAARLLRL